MMTPGCSPALEPWPLPSDRLLARRTGPRGVGQAEPPAAPLGTETPERPHTEPLRAQTQSSREGYKKESERSVESSWLCLHHRYGRLLPPSVNNQIDGWNQ